MQDPRTTTMRHGVKIAIKVAAISVGATALLMAATATDASATDASDAAAGVPGSHDGAPELASAPAHASLRVAEPQTAPGPTPLRMNGWSCISRGPLAPPAISSDFASLLSRVPA